jgi:uncharacterized protein (TIGR02001 family)
MNKLNHYVLSALCAAPLLLNGAYALAEEAAPAAAVAAAPAEPAPPYTLSFNLGLYSNYMFRGTALSDGPAVQGGIDFAHSSGLYAGTWFSTIDPPYAYGNHQEVDIYGGYAHTFDNGVGVNFMGNYYWYPENYKNGDHTYDTFEASAGVSYKFLTYTYYNVLTKNYGAIDSKNAEYHELKAAYKLPVGDLNLLAKVGYTNTHQAANYDQGDFTIGLSRDFSLPGAGKPIEGFNAGAYYTDTFDVADQSLYFSGTRDINERQLTFYIKRTW